MPRSESRQGATAVRARRFSDSPCRLGHGLHYGSQRCLGCMGLHRRVGLLQAQKDKLKDLAALQREELARLEEDCSKLRTKRNLEQADFDLQSYSRKCLADISLSELQHLLDQRKHLEEELSSFRAGPDRLRSSRQAEVEHAAAREAWLLEHRQLKQDVAAAQAYVASLEQEIESRRERVTLGRLADAERSRQLREQVAEQRQLCRATQQALQDAETDLAAAQAQRRKFTPSDAVTARARDLKAEMAALADERREGAEALQLASEELEKLRRELGAILADNAQLRSGLQDVMHGLEQVQHQL
ncbi:unnamed protein product [Symbiodinium pilosum]|uniref:Uncharacterized protein n=1 Tax=Symbiodinium pilosum TaxID=2952 RepID=A0A812LJC7_SYMPI|nr:unnamed protein product [Symbiodinium pilosum]